MTLSNSIGRVFATAAFALVLGGSVNAVFTPASLVSGAEAATVVIQRTRIYIDTLPKGCVKTTYSGGVVVWRCGGLFYQPYNGRYVRVYVK